MFIKKIEKNAVKKFIFALRKTDGSEYERAVFANSEVEAKLRLKNVLDRFESRDEVVQLKQSSNQR